MASNLMAGARTAARRLAAVCSFALALAACDLVPREAVELSNTVGRDLEEVHRAHRELADLHFDRIEGDVNSFIDDIYRPQFIQSFANEFELDRKVVLIVEQDPGGLLMVLERFVVTATERVEAKRRELLEPIQAQRASVIEEIDAAHRQIQSAQAVVTGHLASVRKVREVQNEILAEVGLADVREKVAETTSRVSGRVAEFVETGRELDAKLGSASERIAEIDNKIREFRAGLAGSD